MPAFAALQRIPPLRGAANVSCSGSVETRGTRRRSRTTPPRACTSEESNVRTIHLSALLRRSLEDLRADRSPSHCQRVAGIFRRLELELGDPPAAELCAADVLAYRARRRAEGASKRTANKEVDALQTALRWAIRAQLLARNPLDGLQRLTVRDSDVVRVPRALSEAELAQLLSAAEVLDRLGAGDPPGSRSVPQAPTWHLFAGTGARRGELVELRWANVDEERAAIVLRASTTKSGRERTIPVARELLEVLRALRGAQARRLGRVPCAADHVLLAPQGGPWARSRANLRRALGAVLRAAGIPRVDAGGRRFGVHGFRTTYGTLLARAGVHPKVAQHLLGHADESLTLRFYTLLGEPEARAGAEEVHRRVAGWGQMRDSNPRPPLYESSARGPTPPRALPCGSVGVRGAHAPVGDSLRAAVAVPPAGDAAPGARRSRRRAPTSHAAAGAEPGKRSETSPLAGPSSLGPAAASSRLARGAGPRARAGP